MTTLVAIKTRDCVVMGCDSLATDVRPYVNPFKLLEDFFNRKTLKILIDKDGNPKLDHFAKILSKSIRMPYNHIPYITKLFNLNPIKIGVMTAGSASIGERSIKSIVNDFKINIIKERRKNAATTSSVNKVGEKFRQFFQKEYERVFKDLIYKPDYEFIIGGYGNRDKSPKIFRLNFSNKEQDGKLEEDKYYIVTGGQSDAIDRIIFGIDNYGYSSIVKRSEDLLEMYYDKIEAAIGGSVSIPKPETYKKDLKFFDPELNLFNRLNIDYANFSEQIAIDLVGWLVEIMINAQRFDSSMPTVGEPIHILLITKQEMKPITPETYNFREHCVPI